ncbi:GntR family transcriptional regulator [Citreicella sp. C3M06]|uniref:GntR family transcriptional regulator n=1 Tax=Citreicella sp. C3M06 TaxID=2841564 RepID=UPI001C0A3B15|nr:GntR family transcriptional regulator [Citreicella sp. C3M06]MBU2959334.1 GntR family transcriptional regulator [Citreicella sp. C3M06]
MSGKTLAATAYRELIKRILEGALKPGDTLQETRLCADLDMSRTPVREAIARIRSEGLAEQAGRFMRVRRINPEEIDEIFFLRRTLEPDAVRAATGRLTSQQIDTLEAEVRALMQKGPHEDDLQWHVDQSFHMAIAVAAGNAAAAKVIQDLHMRTCIFDHRVVPERFARGCEEHLALLSALRSGQRDEAAALMGAHLDHARDAIFAHLDKVLPAPTEKALRT